MAKQPTKKQIGDVCQQYNVKFLVLFGSKAKGEVSKTSDTDLAVSFEDKFLAKKELDFFYDMVRLFTTDKLDIITIDKADPLLVKEIAVHGIPLFESERNAFDNFIIKALAKYEDTKKNRLMQNQLVKEFITNHERKAI